MQLLTQVHGTCTHKSASSDGYQWAGVPQDVTLEWQSSSPPVIDEAPGNTRPMEGNQKACDKSDPDCPISSHLRGPSHGNTTSVARLIGRPRTRPVGLPRYQRTTDPDTRCKPLSQTRQAPAFISQETSRCTAVPRYYHGAYFSYAERCSTVNRSHAWNHKASDFPARRR